MPGKMGSYREDEGKQSRPAVLRNHLQSLVRPFCTIYSVRVVPPFLAFFVVVICCHHVAIGDIGVRDFDALVSPFEIVISSIDV